MKFIRKCMERKFSKHTIFKSTYNFTRLQIKLSRLLAIALLLTSPKIFADLKLEELQSPLDSYNSSQYKIPLIKGTPKKAANLINLWLEYSLLNSIAGHYKKSLFENLDGLSGITGLDYKILNNTSPLLTIEFQIQYMGAYPSDSLSRVTFNSGTGQPIQLTDLLTDEGTKKLNEKIIEEQTSKIDTFIASLEKKTPLANPSIIHDLNTQREEYKKCRIRLEGSSLENIQFIIENDKIIVFRGCEFRHEIQSLDDLGDLPYNTDISTLTPNLNTYGNCLLIEDRNDCRPSPEKIHDGIYSGKAGDSKMTIILTRNSFLSAYFSEEKKPPIKLIVTHNSQKSIQLENLPNDKTKTSHESFDLKIDSAGSLIGTWQRGNNSKIPVRLNY